MAQITIKMPALKNAIDGRLKQVDGTCYLPYKSGGYTAGGKQPTLVENNCLSVGMFGLPIDFYCRIDQFICNIVVVIIH